MTAGDVVFWGILYVLAHLLVYIAFRPYTDSLKQRAALAVASFGVLVAIFGPALKGGGAGAIPVYFAASAVSLVVWTAVFHYADRFLGGSAKQ